MLKYFFCGKLQKTFAELLRNLNYVANYDENVMNILIRLLKILFK